MSQSEAPHPDYSPPTNFGGKHRAKPILLELHGPVTQFAAPLEEQLLEISNT